MACRRRDPSPEGTTVLASVAGAERAHIPLPADDESAREVTLWGSALLAYVCFLTMNPYLALFVVALTAVFLRGPSALHLVLFTVAFAVFYASRNVGVEWGTGGDDAAGYLQVYLEDRQGSLASIVSRFIASPAGNEPLFFSLQWIVGKVLRAGPSAYLFYVYVGQLALLSVIAFLVSKRYAIVLLCVYFFGMGEPHPAILHLWRANFGLLVFLIGVLLYFHGRTRVGRLVVYASAGFHLALLLFIPIFELYNLLRARMGFFRTVGFGCAVMYFGGSFVELGVTYLAPGKVPSYFIVLDGTLERNAVQALVLLLLLGANYRYELSPSARFVTFLYATYLAFQVVFYDYMPLLARFGQIAIPMVAIPLFEIVIKQRRVVTAGLLALLFVRVVQRPVSEMYALMIPEYRDPWYGMLAVLFS